jgi:hypothetical protein
MKIFGLPADFSETKKFLGNFPKWQNLQEKPWEYLRIIYRKKICRK